MKCARCGDSYVLDAKVYRGNLCEICYDEVVVSDFRVPAEKISHSGTNKEQPASNKVERKKALPRHK